MSSSQHASEIVIHNEKEEALRAQLAQRDDADGKRLTRYLEMPDLSRTPGSPIYELAQRIIGIDEFKDFSVVDVPEIVPVDKSFDLFDFPPDHPARSRSDTYYVTDDFIMRTHTTVSWYYYFTSRYAEEKLKRNEPIGVLTYGKVYRKDEIDRHHMNVFHQMDGYYIAPKDQETITVEHLKDILAKIVQSVFGPDIQFRFNKDEFPYTDPSLEMEINLGNSPSREASSFAKASEDKSAEQGWIEVLGSGVVKGSVLEKLGIDSSNYTGWAFGFGLERLAIIGMELPDIRLLWSQDPRVQKQLKLGQKFIEVSKYPPITRDISFVVGNDFVPNNYFDLIRDIGGDLIEEVELLDTYKDEKKFGNDKVSYTYRIVYRSTERTLRTEEVDPLQQKIYEETARQFGADLR